MTRKSLVSIFLSVFVLAGLVPFGSATAADDPAPGPGLLQLESKLGYRDNSEPGIAGTTDQGIYFYAEDPVYGYELHYWTEAGTEIIDATVGGANSSFGKAMPYRGGIAVNLQSTNLSQAITGWHDGERMRWLTKSDVSWIPEKAEMAVIGDRIYLYRLEFGELRTLHSFDLGVSGYDIKLHDWGFNIGDVDGNGQDIIFSAETVNRYSEMTGVGTFLISQIEFTELGAPANGLYAVDTSQTQPQWFKLSSKEVDEIEHELESFTVLYQDDSIERFDVAAGTISDPVTLGGPSLAGAYAIEISGGELFAHASGGLLYRLVEGTFTPLTYQGQPLGNVRQSGIAVIDDVAYFDINWQLAAVELDTELVWDVLQLTGDFSTEGVHFAAAWKKQVVFGARSETGNDVFLFDTMTDTLRTIHSEAHAAGAKAEGPTEFDGKIFFYASIPNPELDQGFMSFDGEEIRPLTDSSGRQLAVESDRVSGRPAAVVGGGLLFLAVDTTIDKISEDPKEKLRLWKLRPGDEFPTMIPWPDFPADLDEVEIIPMSDSVVIETQDSNDEVRVWLYRDGATQISELTFPVGTPGITSVSSETLRFGSTDFVRANDQMWIRLGSGNQATVELPGSYFTAPDRLTPIDTSGSYWEDSYIYDAQKIPGLERYLAVTAEFSPNEIALVEITLESNKLVYTQLATFDTEFNDVYLEVVSMAGSQQLFLQADPPGLPGRIFQFPLFNENGDYDFGSSHKGYLDFKRSEILEVNVNGSMADLVVSNYAYSPDQGLILVTDGDDQVSLAFASEGFSKLYPIGNYLQNGVSYLRVQYFGAPVSLGSELLFLGQISFDSPDVLLSLDTGGFGTNLSNEAALFDAGNLYTTKVFPRPTGASHNLTLKANYPEPDPDVVQRSNQATAIDDSGFTRTDFELLGWAESPTGPVVHEPGGIFPFDRTEVLYAKWQSTTVIEPDPEPDPDPAPAPQPPSSGSSAPAVVSVSFATEVGATALNTLRVSAGSQVVLPKLSKAGHVFLGWSETKDGLLVGEAYRPASTVQLHPVFEPLSFKIFLSLPTGAKGESSVMFSGDKELSLPTPTLRDHVFVAWVNAETGERITSDWVPTESVMLAPLFRAGSADEVVNFWRNSKWVSATQMRKLTALVDDEALLNGRRTIVIRGFDIINKDLARGRALSVAIKLRKLGVTDKIVLETELGGSANKAEVFVN